MIGTGARNTEKTGQAAPEPGASEPESDPVRPDTPSGIRPDAPTERERAAAYLDLWERHVSGSAVQPHGPAGPRPRR